MFQKLTQLKIISVKFSLLILVLMLTASGFFFVRVHINNDPSVFLPNDSDAILTINKTKELFPTSDIIVTYFEGENLFSPESLSNINAITEELEEHEYIKKVISITNQKSIRASEEGFSVDPIVSLDEDISTDELKKKLDEDRFIGRLIYGNDRKSYGLVVVPVRLKEIELKIELENEVIEVIQKHRMGDHLKAVAGPLAVANAQARSMNRDLMVFLPILCLVIVVLIFMLYKSVFLTIASGLSIMLSIFCTYSIYGLLLQPFNVISNIVPTLLSALTTASALHLFNALRKGYRPGVSHTELVTEALNSVNKPIFYTCITTAFGLFSLGLSPIQPIRYFGLIGGFGLFIIYGIVCFILPPFLVKFFPLMNLDKPSEGLSVINTWVQKSVSFSINNAKVITLGFLVSLVLFIPSLWLVTTETNFIKFFKESHVVTKANDIVQEKLTGTSPLEIILFANNENEFKNPKSMQYIKDLQTWANTIPELSNSFSAAEFIEEMNWAFNSEKPEFRSIPKTKELISQYMFIYGEDDIFDFIDEEFKTSRMLLNLNAHSTIKLKEIIAEVEDYIQKHPPNFEGEIKVSGFGKIFADQEDLLIRGQINSLIGAFIILFIFMLISWRRVDHAFVSMLPNAIPVFLMFVIMGLFGISLDMGTAMISSIVLGIAIDDTIHIYHGFVLRRKQGKSTIESLTECYAGVGQAITATTFVLCFQFSTLLFSDFIPTIQFGLLCGVGLLTALLFDLILLPAIIVVWNSFILDENKQL